MKVGFFVDIAGEHRDHLFLGFPLGRHKATNMMFFGGLVMGIALEYSNLHKRIALKVIIYFGSSIKKYALCSSQGFLNNCPPQT